jgi:hypothetical protein
VIVKSFGISLFLHILSGCTGGFGFFLGDGVPAPLLPRFRGELDGVVVALALLPDIFLFLDGEGEGESESVSG